MVIVLCTDTTAALTARRTIRCLYRQPLAVPDRRIPTIVAWAKPRVDAFCQELAAHLADHLAAGRPEGATSISHVIHVVRLLHSTAFIAFDIFLADCAVREDVVSQIEQPIHFVFVKTRQSDSTTYIERRAKLDKDVRGHFEHIRGLDKGPSPLISDGTYALTYVDGKRIEREDERAFRAAWMAEAKAKQERHERENEEEGKKKRKKEMGENGEERKEDKETQEAPSA